MKNLYFLVFSFLVQVNLIFGQNITSPKKIGNYEIILSDEKLSWTDANLACAKLGEGWKLPSNRQMLIIAKSLRFIDDNKKFYWTNVEGMLNVNPSDGKSLNIIDYNAAEVIDVISKKTANFDSKMNLNYFVSIRSLGTNVQNCITYNTSSVQIGYLEVLKTNLYDITFYDAKNSLTSIGNGWRLPTKSELQLIYSNKSSLSIDENSLDLPIYWSSENANGDTKSVWVKNLSSGVDGSMDVYSKIRAILVKGDPNKAISNKSYETFRVGALEVMKFDLVNPVNNSSEFSYEEAIKYIKELGGGWRLPSINELKLIYDNKNLGGNTFYDNRFSLWKNYWSSSNQNNLKFPGSNAEYGFSNSIWIMDFGNGKCYEARGRYYLRAVR